MWFTDSWVTDESRTWKIGAQFPSVSKVENCEAGVCYKVGHWWMPNPGINESNCQIYRHLMTQISNARNGGQNCEKLLFVMCVVLDDPWIIHTWFVPSHTFIIRTENRDETSCYLTFTQDVKNKVKYNPGILSPLIIWPTHQRTF